MGNKKRKKEKFLSEHQYCCFCGGKTLAVEPDHFPSRALFDNRQWPEGYIFPACISCNRKTRKEESVVAFLSRIYAEDENSSLIADFEKHAKSLEHNYPGILRAMLPTARQRRDAAKKYNIPFPPGQAKADAPLIYVNDPVINDAVILFSRKLMLALYYKHAGFSFSLDGGIVVEWYTNLQIANDDLLEKIRNIALNIPTLKRCNTSLDDQFFYSYGFTECKGGFIFLVTFRKSFSVVGFAFSSKDRLSRVGDARVFGAFNPTAE